MSKATGERHKPKCLLSHELFNKLSVVIGSCQIVRERMEELKYTDSQCQHHIEVLEKIARAMADDLRKHACELDAALKGVVITQTEGVNRTV